MRYTQNEEAPTFATRYTQFEQDVLHDIHKDTDGEFWTVIYDVVSDSKASIRKQLIKQYWAKKGVIVDEQPAGKLKHVYGIES